MPISRAALGLQTTWPGMRAFSRKREILDVVAQPLEVLDLVTAQR